MTLINLSTLMDALGGPVPVDAVLTFTATRSRASGAVVVANGTVTVRIVAGVPTEDVDLVPSGVDWAYKATLSVSSIGRRIDRTIAVPDVPSVEWADLVDVDPATLLPDAGAVPAWTAAVGQVAGMLADTVVARDAASAAQGLSEDARDAAVLARGIAEGARDGAVLAKGASEAARDQAQVYAANTVELQDTTFTALIADEDSATRTQLNATFARPDTVLRGLGIDPTGVADSTAAIQAKINATPDGGLVHAPTGRYRLTAPLTISKRLTLRGDGMVPTHTGRNSGGSLDLPSGPDFFHGTVFMQTTAGADIIRINKAALMVNLEDFGLVFSGAGVMNTNTGHAVVATPDTFMTGYPGEHECGLTRFNWRNLGVWGNDGNHYGFWITNPLHGVLENLCVFGGGGFRIESTAKETDPNYGNIVATQLFSEIFNKGTAHGFGLSAASDSSLNLITFIRPQCNMVSAAAVSPATQMIYTQTLGTGKCRVIDIISADFESWENDTDVLIDFGDFNQGATVHRGGLVHAKVAQGYNDGTFMQFARFTANGSWTVPNTVSQVIVRSVGGGGGGGGGGSTNTGALQVGGGGGGAGAVKEERLQVTPGSVIAITVGAGGAAGAASAGGASAGGDGGSGGQSLFGALLKSDGGRGGAGAAANSTAPVGGGCQNFARTLTPFIPGFGGPSGSDSIPAGFGNVVGGAGGGAATASNGGGGGSTATNPVDILYRPAGAAGASGTSAGANGVSAAAQARGSGGGGGGGGAAGAPGGAGGAGAAGYVEVRYWG